MKINRSYSSFALLYFLFLCAPWHVQALLVTNPHGRSFPNIQAAINDGTTVAGDVLQISAGTFSENVTVNKSIVLMGNGSNTVITPLSGTGITISSSNVQIYDLKISGASTFGLYASGVSTVTLSGVQCIADNIGAELDNVSGVTAYGCTFSNNNNYGFFSVGGKNFTFSNCIASGNGTTIATGSGMKFRGLTGSSTLTNLTADNNHCHGVEIGGAATTNNITINGGEFNGNGSSNLFDGGGIYIFARAAIVSNITINGPLAANNNITCGIYVDANTSSSDIINGLTIGQSGTVSFSNNGTSKGAGVLLFGNIMNVTITGNFSKGGVSAAAGVIIVGQSSSGAFSPQNVTIANSIFHAGYSSTSPAIALADGQPSHNYISSNNATATGNTFLGLSTLADIPTVIYDKSDDATLGLITLSGNILPVEMVSFIAEAEGQDIRLRWSTATEVNNYGFEVERRTVNSNQSAVNSWRKIGFVKGNGTSNVMQSYSYMDVSLSSGTFAYRLKQIDNEGTFKYSLETQVSISVPKIFALYQNYPNPFNPATTIEFTIPETERVTLTVYNAAGQLVQTIFTGEAEAGINHRVTFNASGMPSGLYLYQLASGRNQVTRKMLVLK